MRPRIACSFADGAALHPTPYRIRSRNRLAQHHRHPDGASGDGGISECEHVPIVALFDSRDSSGSRSLPSE
jgi:hypothetical protein